METTLQTRSKHYGSPERMPGQVDRPPSHDVNERRQVQNIFRDAVHRARGPAAVSVSAEVGRQDAEVIQKRSHNTVPTPPVIAAAVHEDQVRLSVVAPVPEVEFEAVRVVIL